MKEFTFVSITSKYGSRCTIAVRSRKFENMQEAVNFGYQELGRLYEVYKYSIAAIVILDHKGREVASIGDVKSLIGLGFKEFNRR